MAKITKQELLQKVSDNITDNDELAISLLDDIEDSFVESAVDSTEYESVKSELADYKSRYEDLSNRYKERFMSSVSDTAPKIEEPTTRKYIDIKEI